MKGEKTKLFKYFRGKKITITIVNPVDKRMQKFLKSIWNWYPNPSDYKWIQQFYVKNSTIISKVGHKAWYSLTPQERIEIKAIFMVRNHVWKQFHIWNRQFVPRWRVKYGEDTDFEINIYDKKPVQPIKA